MLHLHSVFFFSLTSWGFFRASGEGTYAPALVLLMQVPSWLVCTSHPLCQPQVPVSSATLNHCRARYFFARNVLYL
jgi:hypothetical protein